MTVQKEQWVYYKDLGAWASLDKTDLLVVGGSLAHREVGGGLVHKEQ